MIQCVRRAELTFNDLVQNTVWSHFRVISRRFWRGLRFVLLVGLCTKRRPWWNSLITANLVAPCFCFDRELCSSLFQVISSDFKTILTGSSFCTFGGVMYKTKTLVKFVNNCKSWCSLFLLRSRIMFEPFLSDFKTILTGSSFLGLRSSVFVLYSPGNFCAVFVYQVAISNDQLVFTFTRGWFLCFVKRIKDMHTSILEGIEKNLQMKRNIRSAILFFHAVMPFEGLHTVFH